MNSKRALENLSYIELLTLEQKLEREKILKNPLYLMHKYLGYTDINYNLHGKIVNIAIHNQYSRIGFLLPRGHLKSSVLTIGLTMWKILNNQNIRIGIGNAVFDKASEFLEEIKEHFKNPELIKLFPDILYEKPEREAPVWRNDAIVVKRTKVVSGKTIQVFGIDKGITGKHYDYVVLDDIQDDKNSETQEQIQKVIKRYKNVVSVLEPNGKILVVGTRWKIDDFYDYLQKTKIYKMYIRKAVENGKVIFPQKFSFSKLKMIRSEIGSYNYSCQYNNNPIPEDLKTFSNIKVKEPLFFDYVLKNLTNKIDNIYIIVDPALSKHKNSDVSAMLIIFEIDRKYYVYKTYKLPKRISKTVKTIINTYMFYNNIVNTIIGIETEAYQDALKQWIEEQQTKMGIYFKIEELTTGKVPKSIRIQNIQPMVERGDIIINDECKELIDQMSNFPSITHDDYLDALAYLPKLKQKVIVGGVEFPYMEDNYGDEDDVIFQLQKLDYRSL